MSAAFVAHVSELLAGLGRLEAKRMFGGYGIYCDGAFFAIVLDETLYLKADGESRARFEKAGLERFVYSRNGKQASLNYYRALAEALESPDAARTWAREALAAALRASAATPSRPLRHARKRAKARPANRGRRRTGRA